MSIYSRLNRRLPNCNIDFAAVAISYKEVKTEATTIARSQLRCFHFHFSLCRHNVKLQEGWLSTVYSIAFCYEIPKSMYTQDMQHEKEIIAIQTSRIPSIPQQLGIRLEVHDG